MAIRTPSQALADADSKRTNVVGACQAETRAYYLAPSAGDFDGDGAADAEDGWKSEPATARRFDRNPPAGYPVSFLGGSHDNGHRAISRGHGQIRSTDFDGVTKRFRAGVRGNGTIEEVASAMGVTYVGWSKTIDGIPIPPDKKTRGLRVDRALRKLRGAEKDAKDGSHRNTLLNRAISALKKIRLRPKK